MQKNTPQLWNNLWKKTVGKEHEYDLLKEENSIRWQRIEQFIKERFGDFIDLKVIEVGAGSGTNALLFCKKGARVTVLDYSKNAISTSSELFKRNNCKADFILADALKLSKKLKGKYDVAMSFGLAEHFQGQDRYEIINSHLNLVRKEGFILISVPNKFNLPYRIHKLILELSGLWKFGEEYPFSRGEFLKIGRSLKIKNINFIGDSFLKSFRFINPFFLIKKKLGIKPRIKKETGSFLDSYFSYALVFLGQKS